VANGTATAEQFYNRLQYLFSKQGAFPEIGIPQADVASKTLNKLGIPGIKYLDQGSRTAGKGTSNYVVFDPKILKETKRLE
jgi:hypothetical protein